MPWHLLTRTDKSKAYWLTANHHGLRWEDGTVKYCRAEHLITTAVGDMYGELEDVASQLVCVKGHVKREWLLHLLDDNVRSNVIIRAMDTDYDDMPSLQKLNNTFRYVSSNTLIPFHLLGFYTIIVFDKKFLFAAPNEGKENPMQNPGIGLVSLGGCQTTRRGEGKPTVKPWASGLVSLEQPIPEIGNSVIKPRRGLESLTSWASNLLLGEEEPQYQTRYGPVPRGNSWTLPGHVSGGSGMPGRSSLQQWWVSIQMAESLELQKRKKERRKREDEAGPSRASPASVASVASTVLVEEDPTIPEEASYSIEVWNRSLFDGSDAIWDEGYEEMASTRTREFFINTRKYVQLLCKDARAQFVRRAELSKELRKSREEATQLRVELQSSKECREILLQGIEADVKKVERANKVKEKVESSLVMVKEEVKLFQSQLNKAKEEIATVNKRPESKSVGEGGTGVAPPEGGCHSKG
ncbi:hypothetical protein EAI_03856 [Harpegnathos saltator]|uniref:Uncharacterized protein n=1 Tax=Harpegnathos saltator TaxID=610380 RepID=E2B417_HARSA|nr:hypothetical protein EAI_03856 [Harpegnathos saltator]